MFGLFSLKLEITQEILTGLESPVWCHSILSVSTVSVMGSGLKVPTSLRNQFVPLQIQQMMSYPVGGSPFISKYTGVLSNEIRTCFSLHRICRGEENKKHGILRAVCAILFIVLP